MKPIWSKEPRSGMWFGRYDDMPPYPWEKGKQTVKPYVRYRDTLYPIRELLAEVLCTAGFLFFLGILIGSCLHMVEDLRSTENTLDSLAKTAEEP